MIEKIEILSTDLLRKYPDLIDELDDLTRFLGININTGWHYHLDWTWILSQIGDVKGKRILDAGAGLGVLQWYLVEQGAQVISVDRDSRACIPLYLRKPYHVQGLRPKDLLSPIQMINPLDSSATLKEKAKGLYRSATGIFRKHKMSHSSGEITIYNQDLGNMTDISQNSIDAIISVSALEHNPPEDLPLVVDELERVLKPGGAMFVTLAASRDQDWFHEPSKGWCYTDTTLREKFKLSSSASSNYDQYDELFSALKNNHDLRDHLAPVYFRSDKLGMPWGIWDPKYQPVGVVNLK